MNNTKGGQAVEEAGWTALALVITGAIVALVPALEADYGDRWWIAGLAALVKGAQWFLTTRTSA